MSDQYRGGGDLRTKMPAAPPAASARPATLRAGARRPRPCAPLTAASERARPRAPRARRARLARRGRRTWARAARRAQAPGPPPRPSPSRRAARAAAPSRACCARVPTAASAASRACAPPSLATPAPGPARAGSREPAGRGARPSRPSPSPRQRGSGGACAAVGRWRPWRLMLRRPSPWAGATPELAWLSALLALAGSRRPCLGAVGDRLLALPRSSGGYCPTPTLHA